MSESATAMAVAVPVTQRGTFSEDPVFQRICQLIEGAHTLTEATFSAGIGDCSGPIRNLACFKVYQLPTAPFVLVMQQQGEGKGEGGVVLPQDAVSVRGNTLLLRTAAGAVCSFEFARSVDPADVHCELSSDGYLVVTVPQEMVDTHFDYHNGWAH